MFELSGKAVAWLRDELPKYWKTAIAVVPVVLFVGTEVVQAVQSGAADGTLSLEDGLTIVISAATAYGVYKKANRDDAPGSPTLS